MHTKTVDIKLMDSQHSEYLPQMLHMVFQRATVNKYIIHEYNNKLSKEGCQDGVHSALKNCRCICETKGHHFELIVSMMSLKSSFVFI
jgi:hypothetical protein